VALHGERVATVFTEPTHLHRCRGERIHARHHHADLAVVVQHLVEP